MGRRLLTFGALLLLLLGSGAWLKKKPSKAPPAQSFQRLEGCHYQAQKWNDGDSFHVTLQDGTERIFRLYFVDTPEAGKGYPERTDEQAAYFGISPEAVVLVGHEASEFTRRTLSKSFTVQTRWRTALGRSKLPRFYAVITTAGGQDLAELLVSNGLARIYGTRTTLPDGGDSRAYLARLTALEVKAKAARRGGWGRIGEVKKRGKSVADVMDEGKFAIYIR
jgi:endonuclease YncB( thermonuclease family)